VPILSARTSPDASERSRLPAILCALFFLVCVLAAYPVAEIGMNDDWSYVVSARILAQTGHIVYNGWAAPILGWQLFLGALFDRLLGPSFTAIRASTLLVAMGTAFLMQRTLVRAGVSTRNAVVSTLALVLSPLFLPLAMSFMTDVDSLFCIVLCLYACLRALEARSDRAMLGWLAFAALSNAVDGTVRQIAWLGVLVMFPCTVWLLRRRPRALACGGLLYAVSLAIVFGTLRWYALQPYSVPEPLLAGRIDAHHAAMLVHALTSLSLSLALFVLPVLWAFVPAVSFREGRNQALLACGGLLSAASFIAVALVRPKAINALVAPFRGNYVTPYGLVDTFAIKGWRPAVLTALPRAGLSIAVLVAVLCFFTLLLNGRKVAQVEAGRAPVPWNSLLVLLIPFTAAYIALLLPRGLRSDLFDRYLLLLIPGALILLLRHYQDRVQTNLPRTCIALVAIFAAYAVAGTHDAFCMYRGGLAAISELRAAGVPDTQIDGGLEHNGMTQIERFGHLNGPNIRVPAGAYVSFRSPFPSGCQPQGIIYTPAMVPGYALSYDPGACGGLAGFAPVTYHQWMGRRTVTLYVVKTFKEATAGR
jgi:hypothetical protein